jgi:hypothetical protein
VLARLQAFEAAFGVTPPHPEDGPHLAALVALSVNWRNCLLQICPRARESCEQLILKPPSQVNVPGMKHLITLPGMPL